MSNTSDLAGLIGKIDFIEGEKIAFIQCEGMGVNENDACFSRLGGNHVYHYFNYKSKGLLSDAYTLLKDMANLSENKGLTNRKDRLLALVKVIKHYMTLKDQQDKCFFDRVVLIGVSHGSLIMHGAIELLKMDINITKEMWDNRLHFFTIGSPRHPHAYTLSPYEKDGKPLFYNFYHHNDTVLNKPIYKAVMKLSHPRNPFLKRKNQIYPYQFQEYKPNGFGPLINGSSPQILFVYDNVMRVLIHKCDLAFVTPVIEYEDILNHVSASLVYPAFFKKEHLQKMHTYIQNEPSTYPGPDPKSKLINFINNPDFQTKYLYGHIYYVYVCSIWETVLDKNRSTDCLPLSFSSGGGRQHGNGNGEVMIRSSKKTYKVRVDKTNKKKYIMSNKQRVYLADIKGKYVYVKK